MGTEHTGGQGPARLQLLRRRIERWRWRRATRSPMPAELWRAATELARELGASRVARELGLGYGALKDRLGTDGDSGAEPAQGFVEFDGTSLLAPASVEWSDASGTKVVIRLAAGQSVDVAALVAALRKGSA